MWVGRSGPSAASARLTTAAERWSWSTRRLGSRVCRAPQRPVGHTQRVGEDPPGSHRAHASSPCPGEDRAQPLGSRDGVHPSGRGHAPGTRRNTLPTSKKRTSSCRRSTLYRTARSRPGRHRRLAGSAPRRRAGWSPRRREGRNRHRSAPTPRGRWSSTPRSLPSPQSTSRTRRRSRWKVVSRPGWGHAGVRRRGGQ